MYHGWDPSVTPMTMHKEQPLQVSKLCDCNITWHDCLKFRKIWNIKQNWDEWKLFVITPAGICFKFTCIPSTPLIPIPISASWIIPTSFAPSPTARVVLPVLTLTIWVTCIYARLHHIRLLLLISSFHCLEKDNSDSGLDSLRRFAYLCFLFRRRSAAYNWSTTNGKLQKQVLHIILQSIGEGLSINYQSQCFWGFGRGCK